jgi:predicted nucleic acid-binding protein
MPDRLLIDSSFLYALHNRRDKYLSLAMAFALTDKRERIVPDVALTEVCHLLSQSVGIQSTASFLQYITLPPIQLEPVSVPDVRRARAIMLQYVDARLDFVDCCILALAERLNVTRICTFDRRDFALFRPTHCAFLELLP